jgi:RNA polymerase sigma-54 factor
MDEDDEVEMIIERHMHELENKNYGAISRAMGMSLERVVDLCKVIHGMEPRPGRAFSIGEPMFIVPDIYVLKIGGDYMVVLNEDGIPRLRVSKTYQQQIVSGELKGEAKSYVKDKLKGGLWLMKSIYQRQRTIYRVTEAILKRQRDFFDFGPQRLKPMVLRDIATELSLHESTISRVTTNKFVHTPHGIFELKYFFNSAITRSDGEADLASESVKQKIREMIAAENPKTPLSDQQLADVLSDAKINIARRTVAKYREALGILPSNKRKKFF